MTDSYETIYFPRERKVEIGNATYIVNAHFLEEGETLKEKIKNLIKLEVNSLSNDSLGKAKEM